VSHCKEPCPYHLCVEMTKVGMCGYRVPLTTTERIKSGRLPACLEGEHWQRYHNAQTFVLGHEGGDKWAQLCRAFHDVAWVRYQGFERDYDNEEAARDWADKL